MRLRIAPFTLACAPFLALLLAACGSDGGGTTTPPVTGTVSGQVSAGATGVPGATLTLAQGGTTRTATSSAAGAYSFASVSTGAATVSIEPPTGFALAAGQSASTAVTVSGGQTATANFALMSTLSSIRATVAENGDGVQGVTVRLYNANATSTRATQTTNASGEAVFASLPPGGFDVEIVTPAGFDLAAGEIAKKRVTTTAATQAEVDFDLVPEAPGSVVVVQLAGTSFSPATVTIAPGTTVRWVYQSGGPHTVTPSGHTQWSEALLTQPAQTFEHTFNTTGTFNYFCSPHQAAGMTGVVIVQ